MGTRADFYVGRGESAEWLGSIAWDGYPAGVASTGLAVFESETEEHYRAAVRAFLFSEAEHSTTPEMGWPWPWDDSGTTDYAYAFEDGKVYASPFGHPWFVVDLEAEDSGEPDEDEETGPKATFPNMAERKNVARPGGKRSGVMVISLPPSEGATQ